MDGRPVEPVPARILVAHVCAAVGPFVHERPLLEGTSPRPTGPGAAPRDVGTPNDPGPPPQSDPPGASHGAAAALVVPFVAVHERPVSRALPDLSERAIAQ